MGLKQPAPRSKKLKKYKETLGHIHIKVVLPTEFLSFLVFSVRLVNVSTYCCNIWTLNHVSKIMLQFHFLQRLNK